MQRLPIVFFGSGEFGVPTLAMLAHEHSVIGVVTQPDRPAGRGGQLAPTPVAAWAASHVPGVPIFRPEKIAEPDTVRVLRAMAQHPGSHLPPSAGLAATTALPLGIFVVIAYGQKLPAALVEGIFSINLHGSLLPRWRGAAPINAAMVARDAQTGNTVITIAPRMDAGLILGQSRRPIEPRLIAGELHDLLASDGPALVRDVLAQHAAGVLTGLPQDEPLATRAPKLSKADGWVNFHAPALHCRSRIHGLTPWPGVWIRIGADELKLHRVADELSPFHDPPRDTLRDISNDLQPGLLIDPAQGLVSTAAGTALRLLEVQPPGKRVMTWAELTRGRRFDAGATVVSVQPVPAQPGQ